MQTIPSSYELDFTGTNPNNKILKERHTLTPVNGPNFNILIPRTTPYHEDSMRVINVSTGLPLVKGVDWVPGHKFIAASSDGIRLPIYGTVLLTNVVGSAPIAYELDYQTLGGHYSENDYNQLVALIRLAVDPRVVTWDQIIDPPAEMAPNYHMHNVVNTAGYDAFIAKFQEGIDQHTLQAGLLKQEVLNHANDKNNPHNVTPAQLGLERFTTVYRASMANVVSGENNNYVTGLTVRDYVVDYVSGQLAPVAANINKSYIGLSSVPNYAAAGALDADANANNSFATPNIVNYLITKRLQALPLAQLQTMIDAFNSHVLELDAHGDTVVGNEGQMALFIDNTRPSHFRAVHRYNFVNVATDSDTYTLCVNAGNTHPIADFVNNRVLEWNGSSYVPSVTLTLATLLPKGNSFYSAATQKTFHASSAGQLFPIGGAVDEATVNGINNRVPVIRSNTIIQPAITHTYNQSANEQPALLVVTTRTDSSETRNYRGTKANESVYINGVLSGGIDYTSTHIHFYNQTGQAFMSYNRGTGKIDHVGMNTVSDPKLKANLTELPVELNSDMLKLYEWYWKEHDTVPAMFHGRYDTGLNAREVERVFPTCVDEGEDGYLRVDYAKVGVHIGLAAINRIDALEARLARLERGGKLKQFVVAILKWFTTK